ncbi:MAG: hypothetical protein CMD45_01165, partial [Gammaproteobacteria bacterium]|nr:hypothetical protein [Gammaproteobacteria bacterium]
AILAAPMIRMGKRLSLTNNQSFRFINNKPRTIDAIESLKKTNPTGPNTGAVSLMNTKEDPQMADKPTI